jgi:hypothetical protein
MVKKSKVANPADDSDLDEAKPILVQEHSFFKKGKRAGHTKQHDAIREDEFESDKLDLDESLKKQIQNNTKDKIAFDIIALDKTAIGETPEVCENNDFIQDTIDIED